MSYPNQPSFTPCCNKPQPPKCPQPQPQPKPQPCCNKPTPKPQPCCHKPKPQPCCTQPRPIPIDPTSCSFSAAITDANNAIATYFYDPSLNPGPIPHPAIGILRSDLIGIVNPVSGFAFNTDSPNFDCNNAVADSGLITIQCSGIYNISATLNVSPINVAIAPPPPPITPYGTAITFYLYLNGSTKAVASARGILSVDASGTATINGPISFNVILNLKRNDRLTLAIGSAPAYGTPPLGAAVTFNFDGRISALFVSRAPQNCAAPAPAPVDSE